MLSYVQAVARERGRYLIRPYISFPFPQDKSWKIVDGLAINDFSKSRMEASAVELIEERDMALSTLAV